MIFLLNKVKKEFKERVLIKITTKLKPYKREKDIIIAK
jgi:hypothetical protein